MPLDPAQTARYNLTTGAWCVPIPGQQVGQHPQRRHTDFWSNSGPGQAPTSIHLNTVLGLT